MTEIESKKAKRADYIHKNRPFCIGFTEAALTEGNSEQHRQGLAA